MKERSKYGYKIEHRKDISVLYKCIIHKVNNVSHIRKAFLLVKNFLKEFPAQPVGFIQMYILEVENRVIDL